jgi:hypothetical protein
MDLAWQHIMIATHASWLHGDERGFPSRDHRIHSTGDYKNPPPKGEHRGLREYQLAQSKQPIDFDVNLSVLITEQFVLKMRSLDFRIIACATAKRHLHALAELANNYEGMKRVIGKCKQKCSHAARYLLPGRIWSAGAEYVRIKDPSHFENSYDYIRFKQEPGAIIWSHNPNENWIDNPSLGVIQMASARKHVRLFPDAGV